MRVANSGGTLEIKTFCGTPLTIELELKQKGEEHKEKNGAKEKRMVRERRREMYCLRGELVNDCLHCSPTACVWVVSYQNVRQTFPIDMLLSAACLNVKAIREIGGVKETSQRHLKE